MRRSIHSAVCAAVSILFLGGCESKPRPVALTGPVPGLIFVTPVQLAEGVDPGLGVELDSSAHLALSSRGYRSVPAAVAANMLETVSLEPSEAAEPESLQLLRRQFGIDAVMVREARPQFPSAPERGFVVRWLLVDAIDQRRLWAGQAVAGPERVMERRVTGPTGAYQDDAFDDPFLSDEPVLTRELGGAVREIKTRTQREQAEDVQRRVVERLPYGDG